ncbi:ABC transporter ATP-binding protein [Skermania piniformis]|uniref:ABC transporter ATP-binding protein n=1 Tax=Skermania pinensis TaxID=39122 RepID=A0ABX8SCL6_9ACTN|nr:ABC transporter ATP-binding protein [Skermania piniformis]QXQ14702.1 ABC transporter ATP-binding protein [Skermania piniformis]
MSKEIRLANVYKSFGPDPVLDGIDLTVAPGEFVAVIGPSGCGKSTMFDLAAGLIRPDSGEISIGGEPAAAGTHCGYLPQRDLLFPWRTVLANTSLGLELQGVPKRVARDRAHSLFARFGLAGFESARPAQLSGGMRQRAALLRTVLPGREVLLLDEPFGALDALTRTDIHTWLQQMWVTYRWTVLLITHDVREAVFLADRVVVLSRRPARVTGVVEVALPRPRTVTTLTTPMFAAVERDLLGRIEWSRNDPDPISSTE